MSKYDHDTSSTTTIEVGFSSTLKFLTSINDLTDLLAEAEQFILHSFDSYIKHGSGKRFNYK